jgi:hypothetical protein
LAGSCDLRAFVLDLSARLFLGQGNVVLHLSGQRQRVVDADDIHYLEAQG